MEDCAGSVQLVVARFAKLGTNGAPLAGAENLYVTETLMTLGVDPVVKEGEDIELPNGTGNVCVAYKDQDKPKRLNLAIALCSPDPWLHAFLAGGDVIEDGGEVIGWSAPEVGEESVPDGVSVEAWSKAIVGGSQATTLPWIRWIYPRTRWNFGARNLANEALQSPFTGFGEQNLGFGDGPANDLDALVAAGTSHRMMSFIRDDDVPAASCGPLALAAS